MNRSTHQQGISNILKTALVLFRENGFIATSARQIAERAGTSLGLANHYFGSKELLGAQCLLAIDSYATRRVPEFVSFEQNPILYDLVEVRVLFDYMQKGSYRRFYLDSLEQDFFFKYLSSRPPVLIEELKKHYPIEADPDSILIFSRYMPYMLEKTLMLKKEQGLFPSIPYDQVPLMICTTAMGHFIPEQEVASRNGEALCLAEKASEGLETVVPDSFLENFASLQAGEIRGAAEKSSRYSG